DVARGCAGAPGALLSRRHVVHRPSPLLPRRRALLRQRHLVPVEDDGGVRSPGSRRVPPGGTPATVSHRASASSAKTAASPMIVCCGFTPRLLGMTEASATTRPW